MAQGYKCVHIGERVTEADQLPWQAIEPMQLKEVTDGQTPRLQTIARACWTKDALWIRMECEDDHVYATMTNRDDPLYNEDVVEVFIDEQGTGRRYIELEISPRNVIFDAMITNDGTGTINHLNLAWNADGLETAVIETEAGRIYHIKLPFTNFECQPKAGTKLKWNLYRIDYDPEGNPHYWAWSPTGAADFHLTEHFGTLHFVEENA